MVYFFSTFPFLSLVYDKVGEHMKKLKNLLITIVLATFLGVLMGKVIFDQYKTKVDDAIKVANETIYCIQYGVYKSLENANKKVDGLTFYTIVKDNNYYRIYIGFASTTELANKIGEIYQKQGKDIYIRSISIQNQQFIDMLHQYELLLQNDVNDELTLKIQGQIVDKYKEMVLKVET